MNTQALVTCSILVSHPDFRLLVRSPADNNHETSLVLPTLSTSSVHYARMLVDEGTQFKEHAVAFVDTDAPELQILVAGALSAARPTRVSFVRLAEVPEILAFSPPQSHRPQIAACASAIVARSRLHLESSKSSEGAAFVRFAKGRFIGSVRVQSTAQMFEVSWSMSSF